MEVPMWGPLYGPRMGVPIWGSPHGDPHMGPMWGPPYGDPHPDTIWAQCGPAHVGNPICTPYGGPRMGAIPPPEGAPQGVREAKPHVGRPSWEAHCHRLLTPPRAPDKVVKLVSLTHSLGVAEPCHPAQRPGPHAAAPAPPPRSPL